MKLNKIFTMFMVLFPILYIYNSGVLTLSVADIILVFLFLFLTLDMFNKKDNVRISNILLIIILFIIFQVLSYYLLNLINSESLMTTLRIILYYATCCLFVKEYFDFELGIEYLKRVALIAAIFWLVQYIFLNFFGIFIQGTLPFFKTEVDIYNKIMNTYSWTSYAYARPRSFFAEPSHFAVYEALGLLMYFSKYKSNDKISIIIIILSMFLSGSGMAMFLSVFVIFISSIEKIKKINKKMIVYLIAILFVCISLYPIYSKTNSFQTFYNRTFIEKDSTNGRFGNFMDAFSTDKRLYKVIIGEGIYKIADVEGQKYITSIPRVYTYFGIIGFIFFIILSFYCFYRLVGINRKVWFLLFVICFASEILFHNLSIIYLPFILKDSK